MCVRRGLRDDGEPHVRELRAVLDVDVRMRAAAVGAEEGVYGRRDVQRVRRQALHRPRMALDPPDHRRIESDAGAEEKGPVIGHADADPAQRLLAECDEERIAASAACRG